MKEDATKEMLERKDQLDKMCLKFAGMFEVPEMNPAELQQAQNESKAIVIVDSRNADEQKVSMIPGAITKEEFTAKEQEYKDHKVVCYCTVGYRSSSFAKELRKKGLDAYNLRGCIMAWTQEGLPLVSGADRKTASSTVHSYSKSWAMQGPGYDSVHYSLAPVRMVAEVAKSFFPKWGR